MFVHISVTSHHIIHLHEIPPFPAIGTSSVAQQKQREFNETEQLAGTCFAFHRTDIIWDGDTNSVVQWDDLGICHGVLISRVMIMGMAFISRGFLCTQPIRGLGGLLACKGRYHIMSCLPMSLHCEEHAE